MPLRVTGRIERYLTALKQLIYNQKFRAETSKIEFLQQAVWHEPRGSVLILRFALQQSYRFRLEKPAAESGSVLTTQLGLESWRRVVDTRHIKV